MDHTVENHTGPGPKPGALLEEEWHSSHVALIPDRASPSVIHRAPPWPALPADDDQPRQGFHVWSVQEIPVPLPMGSPSLKTSKRVQLPGGEFLCEIPL